jgi:hypothetical protein
LFDPIIDRATWDAVQCKLDKPNRVNAPRSAALYLRGLVYCGNCGKRMIAGRGRSSVDEGEGLRFEFMCGSYHHAKRTKQCTDSTCLRNGMRSRADVARRRPTAYPS